MIYNQIVTWTAFAILVMFIEVCGAHVLVVVLLHIFENCRCQWKVGGGLNSKWVDPTLFR